MSLPTLVDTYIAKLSPELQPIAIALGEALVEAMPTHTCKLAWGFPCWIGNERVASLVGHSKHVNLQLWSGNRLAEQFSARIKGTGKQLRHVQLTSVDQVDAEVCEIIRAARDLDQSDPEKVR